MKGKDWFALVLVLLGLILLGDNLGLFRLSYIIRLWPVVLIILGLWVFIRRDQPKKTTVEVNFSTATKVEPEQVVAEADDDDEDEV